MRRINADQNRANPSYPRHPWSIRFLSLTPLSRSELVAAPASLRLLVLYHQTLPASAAHYTMCLLQITPDIGKSYDYTKRFYPTICFGRCRCFALALRTDNDCALVRPPDALGAAHVSRRRSRQIRSDVLAGLLQTHTFRCRLSLSGRLRRLLPDQSPAALPQ